MGKYWWGDEWGTSCANHGKSDGNASWNLVYDDRDALVGALRS
jgi:hypothetical protein